MYGRTFGAHHARTVEIPLNGVSEKSLGLPLSAPVLLYSYYDVWAPFGGPPTKTATVRAGFDFDESIALGVAPNAFDVVRIKWLICYTRPGARARRVRRDQSSDGAYTFGGVDPRAAAGVICNGTRRGEYFAL